MDYLKEIKGLIEKRGEAFEEFKRTNDERLDKLAKAEAVSALEEKQARIDSQLTDFTARIERELAEMKRFGNGAPAVQEQEEAEVKSAFDKLVRSGSASRMTEAQISAFAKKQAEMSHGRYTEAEYKSAMIAGSDPDGGYFVLPQLDKSIMKLVTDEVAMMRLAQSVNTATSTYMKRVRIKGSGHTWEGEISHPATTDTPQYSVLSFPVRTIAANPQISQELLQDSDTNVEAELMESMSLDFSDGIGDALINGNDNRKPSGLLSYPTVDNANYSWGSLGFVKTGAAAAFAGTNPGDALIDLVYSLDSRYASNAAFLMNRNTLTEIRKMKDGQGNYMWQPSFQAGQPDRVLGYRIELDAKMPDLAANAFPVAFGDFKRGYLVVRRTGMTMLRDPYTAKPFVVFSTRMRIGGGVQNFEAIKLLKCSA